MNTLDTLTCTIGPSAVTGERCGAPAVTSFRGRDGVIYAECARHALDIDTAATCDALIVGDSVSVMHVGVVKFGIVTRVGQTRCSVLVSLANGGTRTIDRYFHDVARI